MGLISPAVASLLATTLLLSNDIPLASANTVFERHLAEKATKAPANVSTKAPTVVDTKAPTMPTTKTTKSATLVPSQAPSMAPSTVPSMAPSDSPSTAPSPGSAAPSTVPSEAPSTAPSTAPSGDPSTIPSMAPSNAPSTVPSLAPSNAPSTSAAPSESSVPSASPSLNPSVAPSTSTAPSVSPSLKPSIAPSTSTAPSAEITEAFASYSVSGPNTCAIVDSFSCPDDGDSKNVPFEFAQCFRASDFGLASPFYIQFMSFYPTHGIASDLSVRVWTDSNVVGGKPVDGTAYTYSQTLSPESYSFGLNIIALDSPVFSSSDEFCVGLYSAAGNDGIYFGFGQTGKAPTSYLDCGDDGSFMSAPFFYCMDAYITKAV